MEEEELFIQDLDTYKELEFDTPKSLTKDEAAECLNCVGPTFRKIDRAFSYSSCSYAYVGMDVVNRNLTNIDILPYFAHVMFLDLSNNRLSDDSLLAIAEMEQLVTLIVDNNRLQSALVPMFPQLQILSLKNNDIELCEMNPQPNLEYLELAELPDTDFVLGNKIQEIEPTLWNYKHLPKLKELGLRGNGLASTAGINFPYLVSLFLADNDLASLAGLEVLINLKFLHLRNNPLERLDGFSESNRKLFYLNIRDCKIKDANELKKLSVLPKLERLVALGNPFFSERNYRVKVIATLPKLRRIDKTLVDKNERKKAKRLAKKNDGNKDDDETIEEEEERLGEDGEVEDDSVEK